MNAAHLDENQPSFKDWLDAVKKSVKNLDELGKLAWTTDDGFTLNALYTKDDIQELPDPAIPAQSWEIRQTIPCGKPGKANQWALQALEGGVEALTFTAEQIPTEQEWDTLTKNIHLDWLPVYYQFGESNTAAVFLLPDILTQLGYEPEKLEGGVVYDPLIFAAFAGGFDYSIEETAQIYTTSILQVQAKFPKFSLLHVQSLPYREAGANATDEVAFLLATAHQYLAWLHEAKVPLAPVLSKTQFHVSAGPDYFTEIAKLRAIRILWKNLLDRWQLPWHEPTIHVETPQFNKTYYDVHNNLLRCTTEVMAAVIGGGHAITVKPLDELLHEPDSHAYRWARNIQWIAKQEAKLHWVADPSAGAPFIESLTQKIAHASWNIMQEIEAVGGMPQALQQGIVQQRCGLAAELRQKELTEGKKVLVGTSKYVNTKENLYGKITKISSNPYRKETLQFVPLQPVRWAEKIENQRLVQDANATRS